METENILRLPKGAEKQSSLAEILKRGEDICNRCDPLTPITCMTRCDIWKLKNEYRKLYEKMKNQDFMANLLNTLKNKRRLQILKMISKWRYSISTLQKELKKLGYYHSQKTITEEYINPLIEVGLADKIQNQYYATTFGGKINELVKDLHDFQNVFPPHSECYEEMTLDMLLGKPKTFEDLKGVIPAKSVARVLSRLQSTELIETTKEKNYVFYFRTRRDPEKAKFSPTERRVYESIPIEGASARKLAESARISLRRTYKYFRKLKGKKMIFARKNPKSYTLTAKGAQVSIILQNIRDLVTEIIETAAQLVTDKKAQELLMPNTSQVKRGKREKGNYSINNYTMR
jgi:DNA-binding transcriptional regulator YhcF (GntR family)